MLTSVTESELDGMRIDAPDGPINALKRMRKDFMDKARAHQKYARVYQVAYFSLGGVAVMLAVVMGAVDGCEHPDVVLGMSLTIACLTTGLNFFNIETRLQKHDASKGHYESLELEIEKFLLTSLCTHDEAKLVERSMFDRLKMIAASEPDLSMCCL